MQQLLCDSLRPGDIMLKVTDYKEGGSLAARLLDSRGLERTIRDAQTLAKAKNPNVAHAGLMFNQYKIIEAQGPGINENDLRVENRGIGYLVFRCTNTRMANGAATCAKMMLDIHRAPRNPIQKVAAVTHTVIQGGLPVSTGPLSYSVAGAVGSLKGAGGGRTKTQGEMDDLLDDILKGKSHPFFCSQFVVYVYQFVAEQFGVRASLVYAGSDAKVHPSKLATWLTTSALFREAGYMIADERELSDLR